MPVELGIWGLVGVCTLGGVLAGLALARLARTRPRHRRRATHREPDHDDEATQ
jgi:hypothetical protein